MGDSRVSSRTSYERAAAFAPPVFAGRLSGAVVNGYWIDSDHLYILAWGRFADDMARVELSWESGAVRTVPRETAESGWIDAHPFVVGYPDTFKAGVSICGNHGSRNYIAHWLDKYGGQPGSAARDDQSNITAVHRLQGKITLIQGDMDDNVRVAHTLALSCADRRRKRLRPVDRSKRDARRVRGKWLSAPDAAEFPRAASARCGTAGRTDPDWTHLELVAAMTRHLAAFP